MKGFVYLWTNRVNGKKYVGSHIGSPDDGYVGSGVAFRRAIKKYGIESFDRIILEMTDDPKGREQFYLDKFNAANDPNFYNVSPHSDGGWDHVNIEGRVHPKGMLGKRHTEEKRQQISSTSRESAKNRKYNRSRPVEQLSLDGTLIQVFESLADAAKAVGAKNCSNIKYTCDGKWKSMYGFKWKYVAIP